MITTSGPHGQSGCYGNHTETTHTKERLMEDFWREERDTAILLDMQSGGRGSRRKACMIMLIAD